MQHTGTGLVTTSCHYKHNLFDYTVLQHIRSKYWKKWCVMGQHPMTHDPCDPSNNGDPWPTDPSPTLLDSMFYWCQFVCKELSERYSKLVSVLAIIPVPTLTRVQKRQDSAPQLTWIVSLLIQLLMHKGTTCFTQHLTGPSTHSTVGHTINFRSVTSIPSLKTAPGPLGRYSLMSSKELPAGRIASFLYAVAQWKTNRRCTWSIERRHF